MKLKKIISEITSVDLEKDIEELETGIKKQQDVLDSVKSKAEEIEKEKIRKQIEDKKKLEQERADRIKKAKMEALKQSVNAVKVNNIKQV